MTIQVKLFALARELAGASEVKLELRDGATLADVERALRSEVPALKGLFPHARWAVDSQFAGDGQVVAASSEIALIPPVSGG